jgi:hypothetical protein
LSKWFCSVCGTGVTRWNVKFCSDACKPRCSVDGCENPSRKRTWCASHYAQAQASGEPPRPFKHKWSERIPCLNCGSLDPNSVHRRFCSDNCRVAYAHHGGPRPTSTQCVACGTTVDLTVRGKKGQLRHSVTKFCGPCRQDYDKYKMSARELAQRDGTDCGLCGEPVDMNLPLSGDLMRPSVDHVLPRSLGGSHDPSNLQLAHLRCNMRKSNRVAPLTQGGGAGWPL